MVHFHVKYLCQQTTVKQILVELGRLKTSPNEGSPMDPTYNRVMEVLRAQPKSCTELAFKIISWFVKAQRVPIVRELQLAVSVEQDSTIFDEMALPDRNTLLDVCASLVTVDGKEGTVRLAHYTVQEYLLRKSIVPEDADLRLAMACTTFLSLDIFTGGACISESSFESRLDSWPFLDYTAQNLSLHVRMCDKTLTKEPFSDSLRIRVVSRLIARPYALHGIPLGGSFTPWDNFHCM